MPMSLEERQREDRRHKAEEARIVEQRRRAKERADLNDILVDVINGLLAEVTDLRAMVGGSTVKEMRNGVTIHKMIMGDKNE